MGDKRTSIPRAMLYIVLRLCLVLGVIALGASCTGGEDTADDIATSSGDSIGADDSNNTDSGDSDESDTTEADTPEPDPTAQSDTAEAPEPTIAPEPTEVQEPTAAPADDRNYQAEAEAGLQNIAGDGAYTAEDVTCLAEGAQSTDSFDLLTEVASVDEGIGLSQPAAALATDCYLKGEPADRLSQLLLDEEGISVSAETLDCWQTIFSDPGNVATIERNLQADAHDALGDTPGQAVFGCFSEEEIAALAGVPLQDFSSAAETALANIGDFAPNAVDIECVATLAEQRDGFDLLEEVGSLPEGFGMSAPAADLFTECFLAGDPAARAAVNSSTEGVDVSTATVDCWRLAFDAPGRAAEINANFQADAHSPVPEGPLFDELFECFSDDELAQITGGGAVTEPADGTRRADLAAGFQGLGAELVDEELDCLETEIDAGRLTDAELQSQVVVNARGCLSDTSILRILSAGRADVLPLQPAEARCVVNGIADGAFDAAIIEQSIRIGALPCLSDASLGDLVRLEYGDTSVTDSDARCVAEASLSDDALAGTAACGRLGNSAVPALEENGITVTPALVDCLNQAGQINPPGSSDEVSNLITGCLN